MTLTSRTRTVLSAALLIAGIGLGSSSLARPEALAAKMGLKVEWKTFGFDALLSGLQQDRWDMVIASHGVTEERAKAVTFADPHYCSGGVIVAKTEAIRSAVDLAGKGVAVQTGTTYLDNVKKAPGVKDVKNFPPDNNARAALMTGRADAWVVDKFVAKAANQTDPKSGLKIGDFLFIERIAPAVAKGNTGLAQALNQCLAGFDGAGSALAQVVSAGPAGGWRWPVGWTFQQRSSAALLGAAAALGKLSKLMPLRWLASGYIGVIRGTPLLVQILFVFFALPELVPWLRLDEFSAACVALALNVGAYNAEAIRAGLLAVPRGQIEAAESLALSPWQIFWHVRFPQAIKIALPPLVNNAVALLKDSSLAYAVGVVELTNVGSRIQAATFKPTPTLITTALIYLLLTGLLTQMSGAIERRFEGSHR